MENSKSKSSNSQADEKIPVVKVKTREEYGLAFYVQRIISLVAIFLIFIPSVNPARVSELINRNISLLTSAISYANLTSDVGRAISKGWVDESTFVIILIGSLLTVLGIVAVAVASCMSLGNIKMKNVSSLISIIGSVVGIAGLIVILVAYNTILNAEKVDKLDPIFPRGFVFFVVMLGIALLASVASLFLVPKAEAGTKMEMESKYKLFVMFLPFGLLAFVFSYLPLWGWRYAFFDYKAGDLLSMDRWVGLKWFTYLFQNEATKRDIVRVLQNTLAMSGLGIITSWIPLAFAIFLTEIKNMKFRRFVQTFTTVPNFISWILVYTLALAIFSTDGFINSFAQSMGWITQGTNYLMGDHFTWLKMLAWGTWKGVGWGAIIYIAGISGIDKQLYEAATVDGAGRFQRIWNITIPGLLPTYMVMLLMAVAGMLSNGLDQYLVFANASNQTHMEVLDLYVYNLGIAGGSIPLSTVIGMAKSIISVVLLFMANTISKVLRGESIV